LRVMANNPRHTFQVLTKRPSRMAQLLYTSDEVTHILLGCSVSIQRDADKALQDMAWVSRLGWRTFVSFEPALGFVDWSGWRFVDWMICGGESGPGARAMPPIAPLQTLSFCTQNQIPFLFKQWGDMPAVFAELCIEFGYNPKEKKGGRVLNGRVYDEYPPRPAYDEARDVWSVG